MNSKLIIQSGRGSGRGLSPGTQRGKTLAEVMEMFPECKHSIPASLSPGKCCIPRSAPTGSLMPLLCLHREPWQLYQRGTKETFSLYFTLLSSSSVCQCKNTMQVCTGVMPSWVCTPTAAELLSCRGQGSCIWGAPVCLTWKELCMDMGVNLVP